MSYYTKRGAVHLLHYRAMEPPEATTVWCNIPTEKLNNVTSDLKKTTCKRCLNALMKKEKK